MSEIRKFIILISVLFLVLLVAWLADSGYVLNTGFGEYATTSTSRSVETDPITDQQRIIETATTEIHPGKTLWDWLVFLFGGVLAVMIAYFNQHNEERRKNTELEIAEKARQTDREIATDQQRQTALNAYFDKMAEFLLEKDLRTLEGGSEIRAVVRARTLATLRILDGKRKGALIRFLQESKLINKDETFVNIQGADLGKAELIDAHLSDAYLKEVDLTEANLFMADLSRTDLNDAKLRGAEMSHVIMKKANMKFADLSTDDLTGADFSEANLSGANLREAKLSSANLDMAVLRSANLNNADLSGQASMIGADLREADLSEANLSRADLNKADLRGACLKGAKLVKADLSDANMCDATLIGADLREANLINVNLRRAIIDKANLSGTNATPKQLSLATSLKGATMPDGTIHE